MIHYALVTAVYAARRRVDIVMMQDGRPFADVPVLGSSIASDGGVWDTPSVEKPASQAQAGSLRPTARNVLAVVDFTPDGHAHVLGFVHPQRGQMAFTQDDRTVNRHPASGTYWTVAPNGDVEVYHASGAYIRLGQGAHEDLTPLSADQNWQIPSGAPQPTLTAVIQGFTLTVAPGGNTTVTSDGTADLSWNGDVTLHSDGNLTISAGGTLALSAVALTGTIDGGSGIAEIDGTVRATGDVLWQTSTSGETHVHTDVQSGSSNTGPPVAGS